MQFDLLDLLIPPRVRHWIASAFVCAAFFGCKVGPQYVVPHADVKQDWTMQSHPRLIGEPANPIAWWTHFQSPVLNELVATTLQQNLTLREAGQRIEEATARRGVVVGNLYPQSQAVTGGFSKSRLSSRTANFFSFPGVFEPDLNPENWSIGLAASWELDFWGRYRRAIETADASLDATIAAYDDVAVILIAEVASAYVEMCTAERRYRLASQNLDIQRRTFDIATQKQDAGIVSGLDAAQAETNVGQTAAILPTLEIQRRQASNRLCVLLGRPPVDLSSELGVSGQIPISPSSLAFGVPADLLRRRPDVRRAERELAAQSARIGVAQSDFYPHASLAGNIGYSAEDLGKLSSSKSSSGVISPQFAWNILNYGRIKRNVEAETAAFHRLAYAYQASVLNAQREAEDAQISFAYGFDRAAALGTAVNGATKAVEKLDQSYQAGTIDFGQVYVMQAELVRQQDQLAQAESSIAMSLIAMFKALGGGWDFQFGCSEQTMVHTASK